MFAAALGTYLSVHPPSDTSQIDNILLFSSCPVAHLQHFMSV